MSDGSRLRQSWASALSDAEAQFRSLLVSSNSSTWKRVPLPAAPPQAEASQSKGVGAKGKGRALSMEGVVIHRKQTKRGDIMRVVLDVPLEGPLADLDKCRAVISTPEIRSEWDPAVESSSLVEMFDWNTRITRTNYALGWPANPRDAVTISRTFHDATTLIDISTSLPRSHDEPAYLRPAPPYVRSHVHLFAWCIQILGARPSNEENLPSSPANNKLRITCFWQHDLKAVWALSSALSQQLPAMVQGLLRVVQKRGHRLPLLCAYGAGVILERIAFEVGREALNVEYAIVHEEEDETTAHAIKGLEEVNEAKERKRLERSIECVLPDTIGWDVQISTRASSEVVAALPWKVTANRTPTSANSGHTTFRVHHSTLPDAQAILKVKMIIELSGGASGLRLNGLPHPVSEVESRDPASFTLSRQMLQDTSSVSGLSFGSLSTAESNGDVSSSSTHVPRRGISLRGGTTRSSAAEKSILTRVKRNYIYFSSLLQEPEAKWKRNSEARGVTITQLDSIDPTLVVYRAEAVFVGVGLWDLYSTIASPGARVNWDKGHEDAVLLDDVNELTELWHWRTKPNWPANARDVVLLKTVYKSPTTVHVFSFSTDDTQLFSSIPPLDPNIIRTQVDLQGWAIEALSPTTTLVTLLEQSDPRGWANKSWIPQQMISTVAGVGEFAIKCGGPPVNTRLGGARSLSARYEHEKGSFKLEYEGCEARRSTPGSDDFATSTRNSSVDLTSQTNSPTSPPLTPSASMSGAAILPYIECELRCDLDTWASSLEVVIDPPPQTISCLRRHRLSSGGGGLWLTIGHDAVFAAEDRLLAIVRKGASKEKGAVVVNGAKVKVDVEELPESEVKTLTKMKRVKPVRVPLDQPPVLGVIRRRREEWDDEADGESSSVESGTTANAGVMRWATSAPKFSSPLTKFWTMAVEQTTATTSAAVNAVSLGAGAAMDSPPSSSTPPMAYALSALAFLREIHVKPSVDGWNLANDKGFPVHRRLYPDISTAIPVHKGEKVIEGVSAEEVARIVNNYDSRAAWDDRFDSAIVLQEFGAGCHTAFVISKGGFPFRDRGFYVANVTARLLRPSESPATLQQDNGAASPHPNSTTIFCASASFSPASMESFDASKYNPHGLPIGRMMIQGWILETLDPYTTENYAIPSTRCTHIVSVDYAGSVPVAFNSMINATLPRSILAVEQHIKGTSAIPVMRLPPSELALFPDDDPQCVGEFDTKNRAWKLNIPDESRVLVSNKYHPSSKKFRGTMVVSLVPHIVEVTTPRPSTSTSTPLPDLSTVSERTPTPTHSPPVSPASTIRTRRISASSSTLTPSRSLSRDRLRSMTSSSTLYGDGQVAESPVDFLLGELIVDSKLYPDGYEVRLASCLRDPKRAGQPLSLSPISSTSSDLPISFSCHVLPSTPLHSSGLNIDSPPRHLLRFTLPTARYEIPTNDPLSLQPPSKPAWLKDLEEKGAIVEIVVFPAVGGGQRGKGLVVVDGSTVEVMGEKASIRVLRRELEDDRLGRMSTLSRIPAASGSEALPKTLTEPVAAATTFYHNSFLIEQFTSTGAGSGPTDDKTDSDKEANPGDEADSEATDSLRIPIEDSGAAITPTSGFMSFFNGYQNSLFRRASQTLDVPSKSRTRTPSLPDSLSSSRSDSGVASLAVKAETRDNGLYPLSTVLIIGLISFLVGSLLRSLLTPADFIYITQDANELEEGHSGWREIKRLVEFKYAVGGWDFLVGVVRRH